MEIFALVGKSGTGKSYKAQYVAGIYGIDYIIDDGLLINGTKVVAGYSAKREKTRLAATRRAIFKDENHRAQVLEKLQSNNVEKLLIIGTSEGMIKSILKALKQDGYYNIIRIEDISTEEEIEEAARSRKVKGKHVIPVPTFAVKRDFSGYFIDPLKYIRKIGDKSVNGFLNAEYEKTVVRPTFSYLGSYDIKDSVLKSIIKISAVKSDNVNKVSSIDIYTLKEGVVITISVILSIVGSLKISAENMRNNIIRDFEYISGINVIQLNVRIKGIEVNRR